MGIEDFQSIPLMTSPEGGCYKWTAAQAQTLLLKGAGKKAEKKAQPGAESERDRRPGLP
jgi:hypothetical protein